MASISDLLKPIDIMQASKQSQMNVVIIGLTILPLEYVSYLQQLGPPPADIVLVPDLGQILGNFAALSEFVDLPFPQLLGVNVECSEYFVDSLVVLELAFPVKAPVENLFSEMGVSHWAPSALGSSLVGLEIAHV